MSSVTVKLEPAKSYEIKIRGVNHGKVKGPWSDALAVTATTDAEERVLNSYTGYGMGVKLGDAAGATKFSIKDSALAEVAYINSDGLIDVGSVRATGSINPASGAGIELAYASNVGYVTAYDRTGSAYKALKLRGTDITLRLGDTAGSNKVSIVDSADAEVGKVDSNGVCTFAADTNTVHAFGRAKVGYMSYDDYAGFSHYDRASAGNYALLQAADGRTHLNASSTKAIYFSINNTIYWSLDSSGVFIGYGAARTISAAASYDLNLKMGDAAGAKKISFQDSAAAEVAYINSDGRGNFGAGVAQSCSDAVTPMFSVQANMHPASASRVMYGVYNLFNTYEAYNSCVDVGLFAEMVIGDTGNSGTYVGVRGYTKNQNNHTVSILTGGEFAAYQNTSSAGVVTSGYGVKTSVGTNAGTGTMTSAYGVHIGALVGGGAITNLYGIYIDSTVAGASTLNYAIYNASTSPIYSAGNLTVAKAGSDANITASQTGDFFPYYKLIRTGGGAKTNREWTIMLGTTGGLSFIDTTGGATRLSIVPADDISILMGDAAGAKKVSFQDSAAAEVAYIDSDGHINTVTDYKVAGTKVVGAQGAAVADAKADYAVGDLDTEAEIIAAINAANTQLNALLARARAHGLIAT